MSRCFGTPTDFIAKDFIDKRRNRALFCNIKEKYDKLGNNFKTISASVKSGKLENYKSYNMLFNLTKGFEIEKLNDVTDISQSYFLQTFKEDNCNINPNSTNTDISNNYEYHGTPLKTTFNSYPAEGAFDSQGRFWANNVTFIGNSNKTNNVYSELNFNDATSDDVDSNNKFKDKRKIVYTKCPQLSKTYIVDLTK